MKLSKVILFVVCLVLIVGIANAKITKDGALVIPKVNAANAPVVGGNFVIEPVWNLVDATWAEYSNETLQNGTNWASMAGWGKFMYDDHFIYALYYVQDDYIDTTWTGASYQEDGIEMFIDAAHTHNSDPYSASHAYQLNLRPQDKIDSVQTLLGKGLKYAWLLDTLSMNSGGPSGYFLKFKMSLDSLGFTTPAAANTPISFQIQLDDNDGTGRIGTPNWHYSPANKDWENTLQWGDAILGGDGEQIGYDVSTPTKLEFVITKTTTPPVIDGNLDAAYVGANQTTMDFVQAGGTLTRMTTVSDFDYRFYGLYDDHYIYGFYRVYDDYIDTTWTGASYQEDGIEMFIDANNTHDANAYSASHAYQMNLRPQDKIDSVKAVYKKGLDYNWKLVPQLDDTVFSDRGGYTLEFKMSLDSLGFTTPPAVGTAFSFQLQADDNDGTGRAHTANWWYSPANTDYLNTLQWGDAKFGPAIVTSVGRNSGQTIRSFELAQNYPNPFNPSTEISFTLAKSEKVRLAVYNLLGKEVAVLVNGTRNAGSQTVTFNAKNLSSGVYFYKLQAGSTVLAKKMMLLK
jgi:hypothetical protein